jgi:hypothetical protein
MIPEPTTPGQDKIIHAAIGLSLAAFQFLSGVAPGSEGAYVSALLLRERARLAKRRPTAAFQQLALFQETDIDPLASPTIACRECLMPVYRCVCREDEVVR